LTDAPAGTSRLYSAPQLGQRSASGTVRPTTKPPSSTWPSKLMEDSIAIGLKKTGMVILVSSGGCPPVRHLFPNRVRQAENSANRNACHLHVSKPRKSHGGNTTALFAVRIAAKLTRTDAGLEIGRDGFSGAREHAVVGRARRIGKLADSKLAHFQFGIQFSQAQHF